LRSSAAALPAKSTCTEWSTTKSTGTSGSIILGFFPIRATAERMAARSTNSGTPVKSCNTIRATMKGISSVRPAFGCQVASSLTFFSVTFFPSQLRSTASRTSRIETGSFETGPTPACSKAGRE
jgi:hypothetical protein